MASRTLLVIVAIAMAIAIYAPFEIAFTAATLGSPVLRALLIAVLALAGYYCAARMGLRLEGHGKASPIATGMAAALAVAVYVVVIDCFVFRSLLPEYYVRFMQAPLAERMLYYMPRAFNENVIYRLFLFSGLAWLILLVRGSKGMTPGLMIAAMAVSQTANIGLNVVAISPEPLTPALLAYDALRYVAPGVLWAWLFWRNGFVTAEIASVGCHVFLQPVIGALI